MNLIERYIEAVGKHLPNKTRTDIQAEIRSTLEDMLDDRAGKLGQRLDETMIKEVLRDYGAPEKVAASYLPARYLIGPKLFPTFSLVLKIVLSVLTVIACVGFGIRFGIGPMTTQAFGTQLAKTSLEYFGGLISAFGNIVLIFAILERALPKAEMDDKSEGNWDPAELTNQPGDDEVRFWDPIWSSFFTLLGLLVFNFYPQILGFAYQAQNLTVFVPALTADFSRMMPVINLVWVFTLILNAILLRHGRWTPATRWFEIGLKTAGVVIAYIFITGPSILGITAETLQATGVFEPIAAKSLADMLNMIVDVALGIAVIVGGIEVIRDVYKVLFHPGRVKVLVVK